MTSPDFNPLSFEQPLAEGQAAGSTGNGLGMETTKTRAQAVLVEV